jgi:hypothetical protein
MQPVSAAFLSALRGPHTLSIHVEAWRGGAQVGGELRVLSGHVEATASLTASPRRTLNLDLAPARGLWDALAPAGTMLYAWRGVRYVNGAVEQVPLGVFDVDEQTLGYGPGGGLSITAPDLWVRVQRARLETPRAVPAGPVLTTAVSLATEATKLGTGVLTGDYGATTRAQVLGPGDRDAPIADLARTAGAWIYADVNGKVTTRPVPSLYETPVWTVDASASGVLLDANRSRSRQRTYSVVVVSPGDVNGVTPYAPQVVADTDVNSPTYAAGPFGRVPYFVTDPLALDAAQALKTGRAYLRRVTGMAAQLDLTSVVNPALEPGDVIEVLLPGRDGDAPKVERHLIDSVSIPLAVDGTQTIATRSTRPEGDVPDDSG